ncbi:MAG: hypothetical protein ACOX1F_01595 [Erysipelotrichaceae bacterium]|jgi:uncharacterized Fe-S center protein
MANAISIVNDYFQENVVYVNIMYNMLVGCDYCAVIEDSKVKDIGRLVSLEDWMALIRPV